MTKFVCEKCGYRFESQEEEYKRRCGFCGVNSVKREKDAETLLDEVEEKNV